jgi:galactokinase
MDQAASVLSNPSSALYITFFPSLAASPVPLPPRAVFVVANSLKVADKVLSAKYGYNLRVVETLVAARVLANSLHVRVAEKEKITLREVVDRYTGDGDNRDEDLDRALQFLLESDALDVLKSNLRATEGFNVTMDEMVELSAMSKELFHEVYLSWVESGWRVFFRNPRNFLT